MTLFVSYTEVLRAQRTSCQRCPRALVTVARNPILWPAQFLEPFRHWGALTSSFVSNHCSRHCHEHVFMPRSGSSQRSFWVSERVRLRLWGHREAALRPQPRPRRCRQHSRFFSALRVRNTPPLCLAGAAVSWYSPGPGHEVSPLAPFSHLSLMPLNRGWN